MASRQTRNTQQTDQNVLTIFLPLLAVVLLACAAGCCYREKRRKKKLKASGAGTFQEDQRFNDASSVISTSSRRRSYLLSNPSTELTLRTPSRAGSVKSVQSFYSSYGEPPPYSGKASRRASLASVKARDEDTRSQRGGTYNDGFAGSRTMSRSRSMLDINSGFDQAPMRRTHSSGNLRRRHSLHEVGFEHEQRSRYDQDVTSQRSGRDFGRERRNSRRMASVDADFIYNQPPSAASAPMQGRRSSMMRSASQPNLRNDLSKATRTYPQGILKPGGLGANEDVRFKLGPPSVAGGSTRGGTMSQIGNRTNSSRLTPGYGAGPGSYDTYSRNPTANFTTIPRNPSRNMNASSFGASPVGYANPQQNNARNWNSQQTQPSFDPYNVDNYWEFGSTVQGMGSQNPYNTYGSTIGY